MSSWNLCIEYATPLRTHQDIDHNVRRSGKSRLPSDLSSESENVVSNTLCKKLNISEKRAIPKKHWNKGTRVHDAETLRKSAVIHKKSQNLSMRLPKLKHYFGSRDKCWNPWAILAATTMMKCGASSPSRN